MNTTSAHPSTRTAFSVSTSNTSSISRQSKTPTSQPQPTPHPFTSNACCYEADSRAVSPSFVTLSIVAPTRIPKVALTLLTLPTEFRLLILFNALTRSSSYVKLKHAIHEPNIIGEEPETSTSSNMNLRKTIQILSLPASSECASKSTQKAKGCCISRTSSYSKLINLSIWLWRDLVHTTLLHPLSTTIFAMLSWSWTFGMKRIFGMPTHFFDDLQYGFWMEIFAPSHLKV